MKIKSDYIVKLCIILIALFVTIDIYATDTTEIPRVSDDNFIYLDLYYGNVTINETNYSGYVLVDGSPVAKNGEFGNKGIYIYQSNGSQTVWENGLPSYSRVTMENGDGWGKYITNNTNVNEVITSWQTRASVTSRTATEHYISITGSGTRNITIDNIWSSYQEVSQTRKTGGISFFPNSETAAKVTLNYKGDNRFGNIFYGSGSQLNHEFIFKGDSNATITVANFVSDGAQNHFNSAIGGSDNAGENTIGLIFQSGIVFAGTTPEDNCSSIGAGGNAKGVVKITGGTITAVCHSTGVAIGGGIGYSSVGGDAEVEITGGTIYAYNYGINGIPAAAIGGGSSNAQNGNAYTKITITGGTIYAKSVGGTAIGGGGSRTQNGGPATIIIGGDANITALSVSGSYNNNTIAAGVSIGGGTGGTTSGVNGGNATVKISGNANLNTGSIGGGKTNNSKGHIGNATVEISGNPTIQGQFIMAAGSTTPCSFTMSGGVIDNANKTSDFTFLQQNGGAVYIENGNAVMSGGTIKNCNTAEKGGAIYVADGDFIMTSGTITNNSASDEGGAIYVNGGSITVGSQNCGGTDTNHVHPIISNNNATNNGGALSVSGGEITMYCGNLINNMANQNQESNSVYQTGGVFIIQGGELGTGIAINGGNYNDKRDEIFQIRYYAIYENVRESVLVYLDDDKEIFLPNEDELDNEAFTRSGLYLVGWSTDPDTEEGYMLIGNKIVISHNTELYAVWGSEQPVPTYTVYIPNELPISDITKTGNADISATLKYMTNISTLSVKLKTKTNLTLKDTIIPYTLITSWNNTSLENNSIIKKFTTADNSKVSITANVTAAVQYAGIYRAVLTFVVEFNDGK